jgi:nitrite reductase/ring-hydroxylating ferredoxin subunit
MLPDLIEGSLHPWAAAYRPGRLPAKAAGELGRHGLRMAARYADWIKAGAGTDEDSLAPGQGAVVRHGLRPVAVYRDEGGAMHHMSAICPHLKCVVAWNASEQTWDCPCHGSRFNRRGHVINGPANRDLAHLEVEGQVEARAVDRAFPSST